MKRFLIFYFAILSAGTSLAATVSTEDLLKDLKQTLQYGRHSALTLTASGREALDWIKSYVQFEYDSFAADFVYQEDIDRMIGDEMIAGTITASAYGLMQQAAIRHAAYLYPDKSAAELKAHQDKIRKILKQLKRRTGLVFGSDGFMQNGCASPTVFLLVFIPKTMQVHGIDLTPCTEG